MIDQDRVNEIRQELKAGETTVESLNDMQDNADEARDAFNNAAEKMTLAAEAHSCAEYYSGEDYIDGESTPSIDYWTLHDYASEYETLAGLAENTFDTIEEVLENLDEDGNVVDDDDATPAGEPEVIVDGDTTVTFYPNNTIVGEVIVNGVVYRPEAMAPIETLA